MLFRSGLGSLHLAHINRSEGGDQKPFGSAFWHNSARATWFLKNASTSPDGQTMTVGAFNRKSNLTKLHPAIGFELQFTGSTTTIRRINLADVEELAGQLPTWQRIAHVLEAGQGRPQTVAEIAHELDLKPDTVYKTIQRRRGSATSLFTTVTGPDGIQRIALVDRRTPGGPDRVRESL